MKVKVQQPLVLVHGWGLGSYVWQGIVEKLRDKFDIQLIDLPGYGRNCDVDSKHQLIDLASWLIDQLPENCMLLGWSMGGQIALKATSLAPEKVGKLLLLASNPKFIADSNWPGVEQKVWRGFCQNAKKLSSQKLLERFLAIQSLGSVTAREDIKHIQQHITQHPLPSERILHQGLMLLAKADQRDVLKSLEVPCSLIVGDKDSLTPLNAMQKLVATGSNMQLEVIKGAAHAPFVSHPQQFISAVQQFGL